MGNDGVRLGEVPALWMSFTNVMEDITMTDQSKDIGGRTEGQSPATNNSFWGAPISVYTREQALADGVLVDVSAWAGSGPDGMMGGFRLPVAITRALWAVIDIDAPDGRDEPRWHLLARRRGESTRGRAHDVLWMAAVTARRNPDADRVGTSVLMTGEGRSGRLVRRRLTVQMVIDGDGITIGFQEDF
jgi:hypothetical protein